MAFNDGNAITANGSYSHQPISEQVARKMLLEIPVSAGTATIDVSQNGINLDGLSALAISTAGVRKEVSVNTMSPVTITVTGATSLSCTPTLTPLSHSD